MASKKLPATKMKPYLLVVAALVAAIFCLTPWGRSLDHIVYDGFFKLRGPQQLTSEIIFVAIDETSFQEIGLQWPWPRSLHAQLLENVFKGGAKTVAIDILFPEPSSAAEDAAMASVLNSYGTTILGADVNRSEDNRFIVENNIQPLNEFLTPLTKVGHIRAPSDTDGFVRRAELELRGLKSLAYMAAIDFSDGQCCQNLPGETLPLINFSGGPDTIATISYYQALDPEKYLPADIFRDKMVVLGVNTTSSAMPDERRPDHFPIPFTRGGGGYAPGSLVHANVIANLLEERFISEASLALIVVIAIVLATLYGFVSLNLSFLSNSLLVSFAVIVGIALSFWSFSNNLTYISPVALLLPLLAAYPFSLYLGEARQRAYIRNAFSSYVNPSIVSQLEKDPAGVKLGGKQIDGTALFLDIAGFTDLSERHDPETVITFINEFFSALIDVAMQTGGTVERFLGDAIMVIWGAPIEQSDHARLACESALGMALEMQRIADTESERLGTPVSARIGINSGSMTAGNIGGERRFNYTVLGDCVNLAARLEGLNKLYLSAVMIGSATAEQLNDSFVVRYLDTVTVKGRKTPEKIYELVGLKGAIAAPRLAAINAYARGIDHYQKRDWAAAVQDFAQALEADPEDGPSLVLKKRCEAFTVNEPAADWDGIFNIDTK